jgi:serine/threonine protein kinase/tetratricopeptide (TPR) repeat protein
MVGQTISHYRIVSKVGEGGMGVVYLAEDIHLGRRVAIKTAKCKPDDYAFLNRFLREARAASRLSHQHIATIYDYGKTEDGQPYIVMELVEGETLSDLMRAGALTIPQALKIIRQVAEALSEAHQHGIVHRDIKPSNIAINERGLVKVLDFGLAKQINGNPIDPSDPEQLRMRNTQTREGTIIGTPMYFSPEQALGLDVDTRSDLFSLGSVLYECIVGQPAFSGSSPNEISAKVIRDDPPAPSSSNSLVPPELDRITLKSLAKRPEERYQSTEDLMADMLAVGGLFDLSTKSKTSQNAKVSDTHTSELPRPSTRGVSMIWTTLAGSRISFLSLAIAVIVVGIVWMGWRFFGPKPYEPAPEAQRSYLRAVEAMREGAFSRAGTLFKQATDQDPNFALAHAGFAECWTELDSSDKAKNELIKAQDLVRDPSVLSTIDGLRFQAVTDIVKGDFAKAIESYKLVVSMSSGKEKAYALVDLGRAYERNEELKNAIDAYSRAKEIDSLYAAAFLRLGILQGRYGQSEEAYASFDRAYSLFNLDTELEERIEVHLQRAVLMAQEGRVDDARSQLDQALQKLAAFDIQDKRIKVLLNLSNTEIMAGHSDAAETYSSRALELARANGLDNLTTQGIIDIGNAHFSKGNLSEAEKNFNEALRLAELYKGERSRARALLSLSSLRAQQLDVDAARDLFQRALPFYEKGGYFTEVFQAYLVLGRAEMSAGEYDVAETRLKQLLQRAEQSANQQLITLAHENLGLVFLFRQNFPAALDQLNRADAIARRLNNTLVLGYLSVNRAWLLCELGDSEQARTVVSEAFQIAQPPQGDPNKGLLAMAHLTSSRLALTSRDFTKAIADGMKALEVAGTEHKQVVVRANFTVGIAEIALGKTAAGRKRCDEAVKLARELRDYAWITSAVLAQAESALGAGDTESALSNALEASDRSSRAGQHESQWRALAIAALSIQKTNDKVRAHQLTTQAKSVLEGLQPEWGEAYYNAYLARPDVKHLREKLNALLEER